MARNRAATNQQRVTLRAPLPLNRKWALLIAFSVSLLLHALLGIGVSKLLRPQTVRLPASQGDPVTVRLVPAEPKATPPDKRETAPQAPKKAIPQATPPPAIPVESPKPTRIEKIRKIVPPQHTTPRRNAPVLPSALPNKPPAPGEGNPRKDRKPVPLPRGAQEGSRLAKTVIKAEPRIAPRLDAPPLPLLHNAPDTEAGKLVENPSPAVVKVETPVPTAPASPAPPNLAESAGSGAAAGNGRGVGKTDDLGINRGIPFGDVMGIVRGGDPNGGGGVGRGPGGSAGLGHGLSGGVNSYVKPTPRFTLARPPRSDDGPPIHIVYVIDVSGSMEDGGKIGRVRDAMDKALSELRNEDYFNIVFFSDKATLLSKTMRPATASNISAGILSVGVATPGGATNLSAALDMAFQQADVTHIFVMSDGEPTEGITDFHRIAALARQENNSNAHILTLALGRGEKFKGMELLRQLADEGRGKFNYIDLSKR